MQNIEVQKLLDLVDDTQIHEFFEEMQKLRIIKPLLADLRKEFIAGKADKDFPDRLKTFVSSLSQKDFHPLLFPDVPVYNLNDLVGRGNELAEIHQFLEKGENVVLMNGIGGIGKTTIAKAYTNHPDYTKAYDGMTWLTINTDFQSDFVRLFDEWIEDHTAPIQQKFDFIYKRLVEIGKGGNFLMVIDHNATNIDDLLDYVPKIRHLRWKVLMPSRLQADIGKLLPIDKLPPAQAAQLFARHFGKAQDDTDFLQNPLLHQILAAIHFHTLLIEVIAKTAKKNPLLKNNLKKLHELLETTGLESKEIQLKIEIPDHLEGRLEAQNEYKTCFAYLNAIFLSDLLALSEGEKHYLRAFSVLPAQVGNFPTLCTLFGTPEDEQIDLMEILDSLINKGLVQVENEIYSCHLLIQSVSREQLKPTTENCQFLIKNIADLLYVDQSKEDYINKKVWKPYADSLLKYLTSINAKIARLQTVLALIEKYVFGNYNKAKDLLLQSLEMVTQLYGKKHEEVANRQSNLALVYQDLGGYAQAKDLLEKALASDITNFGEKHPTVTICQSNLATVYYDLGEYAQAKDLLEKALASDTENFGEKHPTVATLQSNLAMVYQDLGGYAQAKDLLEKALASDIANFGEKHPKVATRQSNLAGVYYDLGEYTQARDLLEKALTSDIENFIEKHPKVAFHQHNLGVTYYYLQNYLQAKTLVRSAWLTFIAILPKNHPYIAKAYSWLLDIIEALEGISKEDFDKLSAEEQKALIWK
jgi:tetratricopeptide (TPR) repeat protein